MYRDKIIEDLVIRYKQYLEHQEDNTLQYLYEDPELIIEPKVILDNTSTEELIEMLESRKDAKQQ